MNGRGDHVPRVGNQESLYRSAQMSLVQIYMPTESAHAAVTELAQLGNVMFKDLNPDVTPFQRTFVSDIRRLDEMDRRVRFLQSQMEHEKVPVRPLESALPFLNFSTGGRRGPLQMDELSTKLREHEDRIGQMNGSYETLQRRLLELQEARHVLRETAVFFNQADGRHEHIRTSTDDDHAPLLDDMETGGGRGDNDSGFGGPAFDLEFVAGTIERSRMPTFERILWRVLRGNLYMNYAEIDETFDEPGKEEPVRKNVFIIFAHGQELLNKIRKIAESMSGTLYPIDSSSDKREAALRDVHSRIEDLNNVLFTTSATRRTELVKIAETLSAWADVVRKEKLVYATMNNFLFDSRRKTLIAEGWCPTFALQSIQLALQRAAENAGTNVPPVLQELKTKQTPPTYQLTNKFTAGFQSIVDAYGIAAYGEVNPGLTAVINFPFLFAVMFGDIGHGLIMTLTALAMVVYERRLSKLDGGEIFDMFFYGRYMILLMGAFSVYTGFIYNDIFSKSLNLFKTGFDWPANATGTVEAQPNGNVYLMGLDPTWHGADNNLVFTNSIKMKMSVVLGVLHMSLSICTQVPNFIHFGRPSSIITEFLPQILFLHCLFGYLVFMIIYKWSVDWYETDATGNLFRNNPPSLLNALIYMFLKPGQVEPEKELYSGQAFVQTVLLGLAFICVPWMLAAKPYLIWKEKQRTAGQGYSHLTATDEDEEEQLINGAGERVEGHGSGGEGGEEHGEEFGEVVIHQIIHTIEFCLGAISNTASYLRLWALSLAHAQLSEVLWTMTIQNVFGMTGITGALATVAGFAVWFAGTISILCGMEALSATLHAVRLQWVEYMGKSFIGGGTRFEPLSFEQE
ncbi:V0/A0 complex, 116-kDa subunit of ATPase, partial [Jaminaea rosea]